MKTKKRFSVLVLFGMLVGISVFMISCSSSKKEAVVTIDNIKIGMNELMYYIYQKEEEGNNYEQFYESYLDSSYWDMAYDEERTFRQVAKEEVLEDAIMYTIFAQKAEEVGYSLTEQEKTEVSKEAEQFFDSLSKTQKEKLGLTLKELITLQEKISLGSKYYDELMDSILIDETFIISQINVEEYRQYDVSYIHIPTVEYDENSNRIEYNKKQKKEAYEKMVTLLSMAKQTRDFNDLLSEDEVNLEIGEIGFVEGDELFGPIFEKEALKLENGQTADKIIEEEDGYYIVRMDNKNSTETYDEAVEQLITVTRYEGFQKIYNQIKKDYNIEINTSLWDSVTVGNMIYEPKEETE